MMEDLLRARTARLLAITDILESCQLMGERADIQTIIEAVEIGIADVASEPEQARALTEDEKRILCGLGTALKAVADMAQLWAQTMQPGRIQRKLLQLRATMHQEVLGPRLERLSPKQVDELFIRGTYWSYMIMETQHQLAMLRIMERAAAGKPTNKVQRTNAQMFLRIMRAWMPLAQDKPTGLNEFDTSADPMVADPQKEGEARHGTAE
jgi:hypothetical protein